METWLNFFIVLTGAVGALVYMVMRMRSLRKVVVEEESLLIISQRINIGVKAFIKKQYSLAGKAIFLFFLLLMYLSMTGFLSVYTPYAVFSGAFFSALSAYFGLTAATKTNAIIAFFTKKGLNPAFRIGLKGGSVMGFSVCGFGLLDLSMWYLIITLCEPNMPVYELMGTLASTIITFAFGASLMAFMARVSGGILTKIADSAADTVGKGEYGWAEDDPRNPATIADGVGDNVSDVAGMGQDLNESYVGGNAASMEAGYQSFQSYSLVFGATVSVSLLVMLPLAISVVGIFASMIGLTLIRAKSNDFKALLASIRTGVYATSILIALISAPLIYFIFGCWDLWYGVIIGLLTGNAIAWSSEYYTSSSYGAVRRLAMKAKSGHASVIIEGESLGKESVFVSSSILIGGMLASYYATGHGDFMVGIYGVSISAVSMLSTLPITLTIDAFGPMADNAQGLLEMSGIDGHRAKIGNNLDALGNTTAATGKGYAIASAAFTAIALINALWHSIEQANARFGLPSITLDEGLIIWAISGLLLGAATPYFFTSYLLRAVGNGSNVLVNEIHRQIKEDDILSGKNQPNYKACIDIALATAHKYSILPAVLVIIIPFLIFVIGGGFMILTFLVSALFSAFCLAVYQNNAGGAWDNAKKMIEAGFLGGKNTDAHKASITGDIVGDPYKDTAGPALNILIKLMVTFSILMTPLALYLHHLLFS